MTFDANDWWPHDEGVWGRPLWARNPEARPSVGSEEALDLTSGALLRAIEDEQATGTFLSATPWRLYKHGYLDFEPHYGEFVEAMRDLGLSVKLRGCGWVDAEEVHRDRMAHLRQLEVDSRQHRAAQSDLGLYHWRIMAWIKRKPTRPESHVYRSVEGWQRGD